jgi:uncharacterized protein YcfL
MPTYECGGAIGMIKNSTRRLTVVLVATLLSVGCASAQNPSRGHQDVVISHHTTRVYFEARRQ